MHKAFLNVCAFVFAFVRKEILNLQLEQMIGLVFHISTCNTVRNIYRTVGSVSQNAVIYILGPSLWISRINCNASKEILNFQLEEMNEPVYHISTCNTVRNMYRTVGSVLQNADMHILETSLWISGIYRHRQ